VVRFRCGKTRCAGVVGHAEQQRWPHHPLTAGAQYQVAHARSGIYPSAHAANASRCPLSTDAAERADDLVNLLDRESHLAVVHSLVVLCRQ
jgi:hypothetical protein